MEEVVFSPATEMSRLAMHFKVDFNMKPEEMAMEFLVVVFLMTSVYCIDLVIDR